LEFLLKAYGLTLTSNVLVPGLAPASAEDQAQVRVTFSEAPAAAGLPALEPYYVSPWSDARGVPGLRVWQTDSAFHLIYSDGLEFRVNRGGTDIAVAWPAGMPLEELAYYFLGPALGFLMRIRGTLCLHASAIVMEGRAVLFAGGPGAGKSTLAASFAQAGFPVLSDDIAAIHRQAETSFVQPGYPRLRLWPDSVTALFGRADALPQIAADWDKRYFPLSGEFATQPAPLAAVYLLASQKHPGPPAFEPVPALEGVTSIVGSSYGANLLNMSMRAGELRAAAALVHGVTVRRLTRCAAFDQTTGLIDAIVADIRTQCTPSVLTAA
jgi:hypothetical protein